MAKSNIHGADLNGFGLLDSLDAALELPQEEKAAAPVIRKPDKKKMTDVYDRQTYWIKKEFIRFVEDYAYTERLTIRQAVNHLLEIGIDHEKDQYDKDGRSLMHPKKEEF